MSYYIDDNVIEEIREKVEIVDLINQYLPLKKAGANHVGLCPFHTEKTPSFSVSEANQFFHCFGCGAGGDIFEFIMKKENLSFVDAVKFLADKYGVELRESTPEEKQMKNRKDKYFEINRLVAKYFLDNLAINNDVIKYLEKRNISYKMSRQFGLGYAKDSWDDLYNMLKSSGYEEKDLEDLGLIGKKKQSDGYYDKFRNRLIFPIIDVKSRVIGFGGRVLDDSMPKYLNSQETPVFNKGNSLYGLNMIDRYSNKENIILVEGYMDVISLFNNGINFAVASLGTAFTNRQAQLIKRYGKNVYICYDSDEAGTNATNKAIEILLDEGIKPKIISLGQEKDPDEFFKTHTKNDFLKQMELAINFMDFKINIAKKKYNLDEIEGKIRFTNEVAKELRLLKNSIEQDVYINQLSEKLNIDKEAIKKEVSKNYGKNDYKKSYKENYVEKINPEKTIVQKANLIAEIEILKIGLMDKNYYINILEKDCFKYFENQSCIDILALIDEKYRDKEYLEKEELYGIIEGRNDLDTNILNNILKSETNYTADNVDRAINDLVRTLRINKLDNRRKEVRDKIENLDRNKVDLKESNRLLEELLRLNSELDKIRYKDRG